MFHHLSFCNAFVRAVNAYAFVFTKHTVNVYVGVFNKVLPVISANRITHHSIFILKIHTIEAKKKEEKIAEILSKISLVMVNGRVRK